MSIMQHPTLTPQQADLLRDQRVARPPLGRSQIRVLLVVPSRPFGEALRRELESHSDMDVVGHAMTTRDAVRLVSLHAPDIVLTDLEAPGFDGISLTQTLIQSRPDLGIVVLTQAAQERQVFSALAAGARGTVLKSAFLPDMLATVRAVANGEARLSPDMTHKLLGEFRRMQGQSQGTPAAHPQEEPLTEREETILTHVVAGRCNKDIARQLTL